MQGSRLTLGYREVESLGTPLLPRGEQMRGHEFHWHRFERPIIEKIQRRGANDFSRERD